MKKKLITLVLLLTMSVSLLTGCGEPPCIDVNEDPSTFPATEQQSTSPDPMAFTTEETANISGDFNESLMEFLNMSSYSNENFMVSPTSLRAALAMAVAGADGETKTELLKAMGFSDEEEMLTWYDSVKDAVARFDESLAWDKQAFEENREYLGEDAVEPDGAFELENSIWKNTKASGTLKKEYQQYVQEHFDAASDNVKPEKITDAVNNWINDKTHGMIPQIAGDLSYADLVLVNTLYLRSSWLNSFYEWSTKPDHFKTLKGDLVQKDFMQQQNKFRFYEDADGKFVVLPMAGGIRAVFILGKVTDLMTKLNTASFEEVDVRLPKFETETSFSQNELIAFCMARGAKLAFSDKADFSLMSDDMSLGISDIIQKTKIKVEEDGIEAAAATAIVMTETSLEMDEPEVKEFYADEPFRYMLLTDDAAPEILFYGQLVE
ncbi:MAG: hypothetical protein K6A92_00110 [Lachnospiraceae bacterium]|nr:hypothetical protein [Lachnospiraceae bacterium]